MTILERLRGLFFQPRPDPWVMPYTNEPPVHALERWEEEAKLAATLDKMKAIGKEIAPAMQWACVHCHTCYPDMLTLNQHYEQGCPLRNTPFNPEAEWAAYADSIEYAVLTHAAETYWHKGKNDDA